MVHIIVTGDKDFADIDTLACAVSYSELLGFTGVASDAVLVGELNYSITKEIKDWKLNFLTQFQPDSQTDAKFVVVDRSDPEDFPPFIDRSKIIKIFDHHIGFLDYWKEKLGHNSIITDIGSCATLIWEQYKEKNLQEKITQTSARLLYTAIISNTLNFNSSVTTESDKRAFRELSRLAKLPSNWVEIYFKGCEENIQKTPREAIIHDTKVIKLPGSEQKLTIGQIELWDSKDFINKNQTLIEETLLGFGNKYWFMVSPSISEKKSYFYCKRDDLKNLLSKVVGARFDGDLGVTGNLWIRKEIREALQTIS